MLAGLQALAVSLAASADLGLAAGPDSSRGLVGGVVGSGPPESATPEVEKTYERLRRDWRRAARGQIRLGGISDGQFNIYARSERIVVVMPVLRARWLPRTRAILERRYRGAPVHLRLSRLARPEPMTPPAIAPRRGKPLQCPAEGAARSSGADWNAKEIVGHHYLVAQHIARRHGCEVRAVIVDGMRQAGTSDLRYDRVNVVLCGKRVVRSLGIA